MSLRGLPDWHEPQRIGDRIVYAAFERPGSFHWPPQQLVIANGSDGLPELRMEIFQQDRDAEGLASFGMLRMRFAIQEELGRARESVLTALPWARLETPALDWGAIRFSAASAFALPDAFSEAQPLDPGGVGGMLLRLRFGAADAELFLHALKLGMSTVFADAWIGASGVAARCARRVSYDPAALRRELVGSAEDATLSVDALLGRLAQLRTSALLRVSAPVQDADAPGFAAALLDRLLARGGSFSAPPRGVTGSGVYVRLASAAFPAGEAHVDLAEPVLARRAFAVGADPLGPARALTGAELEQRLVRRLSVPALASGAHRIALVPNLPSGRAGVLRVGADVHVPPNPPARPHAVRQTAVLDPGGAASAVELRLSPGEPLRYSVRTVVLSTASGRAESTSGPERWHDGSYVVLAPDVFPFRLVPVEAEAAFLREARIELECSGVRGAVPWSARATLDAAHPTAAFWLPPDLSGATFAARAIALADGEQRRMSSIAADPLWLDPFSFEGTGRRELVIQGEFVDAASVILLECAPEDRTDQPARRSVLHLTPVAAEQSWSYVSLSPFRSGYCWRRVDPGAGTAGPWSEPQQPDMPLVVSSSGARFTEGVHE